MNCPNCGAAVQEGTKFCMKCGRPVSVPEAAQQAFRQAAPAAPTQPQPVQPPYQQPYGQPQFRQPMYGQPPMPPVQKKAAPFAPRIIGIIAAILIGISVFLPYVKAMGFSVTLMDGEADAYIFLGIAVVGLIFAITNIGIGQIIMGAAAIVCQIIEWNNGGQYSKLLSKGIGYYTILIGAILLIIGGIITMVIKHNIKAQKNQPVYYR